MGVGPSSAKIDLSKIKRGPIVAALIIGAFVSILNETLLNIAFPSLMEQFGIGESTVQWLSTSYMLVVGILVPITALLQLWFTTRQMFIGAMSLFLIGTIICGFSPVFGVLLVGRILQAVGTGLMLPVLMNTILSIYPPQNRGAAMGMIGLVIMTAPAIGPTLSGLIVDALNWRWLFYLVIPLAAFSIVFAAVFLRNVSELTKPKVDFISIILSTIGFGESYMDSAVPAKALGLIKGHMVHYGRGYQLAALRMAPAEDGGTDAGSAYLQISDVLPRDRADAGTYDEHVLHHDHAAVVLAERSGLDCAIGGSGHDAGRDHQRIDGADYREAVR